MSEPTLEAVRDALARVLDPVYDKPMLELGTLEDVRVEGATVQATAVLASPSEALKDTVRARVEEALSGLDVKLALMFKTQVPTREVMGDDPIPGVRNIILVMSGKGGVGKSTTAVNLTLALKAMGLRVGLLDADIYGPSIPTMMGVSGHPVSKDGKRIAPLERFGVSMMSIGFLLEDETQAIVWRGPMLHGALSQFLKDVDWGELDYLVLDLPPGTGDVALTMAQQLKVTGVVMVTTPQEVALQDVYKSVSMCAKLNLPILGVIENMSWFVDTAGALRRGRRPEGRGLREGPPARAGAARALGPRVGRQGHAHRAVPPRLRRGRRLPRRRRVAGRDGRQAALRAHWRSEGAAREGPHAPEDRALIRAPR